MSYSKASTPSCVFLFDMGRCRSHLFFRYLSTHPEVETLWHPFLPAFLVGPERFTLRSKNHREEEWLSPPADGGPTYIDNTDAFLNALKAAQDKNKVFVANEHCQMVLKQDITFSIIRNTQAPPLVGANPTVIPDHVLDSLLPVFIIRNPVASVPSSYVAFSQTTEVRLDDEDWKGLTGGVFQRFVFDFLRKHRGITPIVVDGDDVVWRTEELRQALGQALGLDYKGFSDVWDAVPDEQRSEWPQIRHFLSTIDTSTGIQRNSPIRLDYNLDAAYHEWIELFGADLAAGLKSTVEENMPHYEYLRQFKI